MKLSASAPRCIIFVEALAALTPATARAAPDLDVAAAEVVVGSLMLAGGAGLMAGMVFGGLGWRARRVPLITGLGLLLVSALNLFATTLALESFFSWPSIRSALRVVGLASSLLHPIAMYVLGFTWGSKLRQLRAENA